MEGPKESASGRVRKITGDRMIWVAVAVLTLAGLGFRLHRYSQGLFGDELSTLWIVSNNGLSGVLSTVHSDAEITPPLYFVLSWLAVKLGSAPELVRLPALIAGVLTIPSVFLLGRRLTGAFPALLATTVVTFSPLLINNSGEGRGYSTMLLALILAALCMLQVRAQRGRVWWIGWAVFSCAALYSHYTAIFVVAALFLWSLWAMPRERKWLLGASVLAALAYLPWLSGYVADSNSPTTELVAVLTTFDLKAIVTDPILLTFSTPYAEPSVKAAMTEGPGPLIAVGGLLLAATGALIRRRTTGSWSFGDGRPDRQDVALILLLLLAVPVGEILYSLVSSNIFGMRNLTAAWPGIALAIGLVVGASGRRIRVVAALAVSAGFVLMAIWTLGEDRAMPDYGAASEWAINEAGPDGTIVETTTLQGSPTPLTPLGAQMGDRRPEFQLGLPPGEPPFYFANSPDEWTLWRKALERSRGSRLVLVEPRLLDQTVWDNSSPNWVPYDFADRALANLPSGFEVVGSRTFPGVIPLEVTVISGPSDPE